MANIIFKFVLIYVVFILVAKAPAFLRDAIEEQYTGPQTLDQSTLTEGAKASVAHYAAYDKPMEIAFVQTLQQLASTVETAATTLTTTTSSTAAISTATTTPKQKTTWATGMESPKKKQVTVIKVTQYFIIIITYSFFPSSWLCLLPCRYPLWSSKALVSTKFFLVRGL